jgi:dimethylhistidine N-methyltransferase
MTSPSAVVASPRGETTSLHQQFFRDVIHGLRRSQKEIPCKYFYDELGSSLFDEICELDEYYLTRTELAILKAHAASMADVLGEDCELIEFGTGSGLKTRLLLEQLRSPRAYLPVDIAKEHLERSASELSERFPKLRVLPVNADFTEPLLLPDTGDPRARRVVYFPGSTIGNFSPRTATNLMCTIAWLVGEGGGMLVGYDLDKDESIVWPAYNDGQGKSAAFNLNLLERINRELGADFDVAAFSHRADYVRSKERMEMYLVSREPQVVTIGGMQFIFDQGETIHTEYSYKYSLDHFNRLTARAGFTVAGQWMDPKRYFVVQYLAVN